MWVEAGEGLGVGERQREEKEGTRGADARGTTPRLMFEGSRMKLVYLGLAGAAGGGWRGREIFGEDYVLFVTGIKKIHFQGLLSSLFLFCRKGPG